MHVCVYPLYTPIQDDYNIDFKIFHSLLFIVERSSPRPEFPIGCREKQKILIENTSPDQRFNPTDPGSKVLHRFDHTRVFAKNIFSVRAFAHAFHPRRVGMIILPRLTCLHACIRYYNTAIKHALTLPRLNQPGIWDRCQYSPFPRLDHRAMR